MWPATARPRSRFPLRGTSSEHDAVGTQIWELNGKIPILDGADHRFLSGSHTEKRMQLHGFWIRTSRVRPAGSRRLDAEEVTDIGRGARVRARYWAVDRAPVLVGIELEWRRQGGPLRSVRRSIRR